DFNQETLKHVQETLNDIKMAYGRSTPVRTVEQPVQQLLKESSNGKSSYDFIYCAGLFDYLSDRVCKKLVTIFYEMLTPGGLVIVTNMDAVNPSRNWMEYVLEWHLLYRSPKEMASLVPAGVSASNFKLTSD